jgi:hypothetical protein
MTQLNPSEAKSGTGSLIVVRLAGKGVNASGTLGLEKAQLAQRDGIEIPTILVPGQLAVGSAANAQPTSTPLPTQAVPTLAPRLSPAPSLSPTATSIPATQAPQATSAPTSGEPTAPATDAPSSPAEATQPSVATTATVAPAARDAGAPAPTEAPLTNAPVEAAQNTPMAMPTVTAVLTAGSEATEAVEVAAAQAEPGEPPSDAAAPGDEGTSTLSRIVLAGSVGALCLGVVGVMVVAVLIYAWRGSLFQ